MLGKAKGIILGEACEMCSGRSGEELSSARKALTFAKGPCNKARNSQQANPDAGMYKSWDADGNGQVHWFGNDYECPGKEMFLGRNVALQR